MADKLMYITNDDVQNYVDDNYVDDNQWFQRLDTQLNEPTN